MPEKSEMKRIVAAFGCALAGLKATSTHPAFRIELITFCIMAPLAFCIGHGLAEHIVLFMSLMLVLITELLNTAIERAIDRISQDWHPVSKLAKDTACAAVFLSLVNAGVVWLFILLG